MDESNLVPVLVFVGGLAHGVALLAVRYGVARVRSLVAALNLDQLAPIVKRLRFLPRIVAAVTYSGAAVGLWFWDQKLLGAWAVGVAFIAAASLTTRMTLAWAKIKQ